MADDSDFLIFVRLVASMRAAQVSYFAKRDALSLQNSKALERQVDKEVARMTSSQSSLWK
jgi:hypothetical protein